METVKERNIEKVEAIVKQNRWIIDRISRLKNLGFEILEVPMGSGGVLQRKEMSNGKTRVQISHGWGRCNYAYAVEV